MVIARTNADRKTRLTIITVMFLGMGAWFGYDGFVGYPKKNLKWGMENLPVKPEKAATNHRITLDAANEVSEGTPVAELESQLGEPVLRMPAELRFLGEEIAIIVRIKNDEVIGREKKDLALIERPDNPNRRISEKSLELIEEGMSAEQVRNRLGVPASSQPPTLWYIGPAAYLKVPVKDGAVTEGVEVRENEERTEKDILLQKVIAAVLFMFAAFFVIKLLRECFLRVAADEEGLRINRRLIPWDAVKELETSRYEDKGWLDVLYDKGGGQASFRLDSYHLTDFEPLMQEIALRKGWTWGESS